MSQGPPHRRACFTLIELMIVTGLLALIVGMTVVRLDGWGESGRLRSAARQIGAIYRTARVAATTDGRPRVFSYEDASGQGTRMCIQSPALNRSLIQWHGGEGFRLTGGVRIQSVVQGDRRELLQTGTAGIWIGADGIARSHVAVLTLAGRPRAAIAIDGVTGEDRFTFIVDPTAFDPLEFLEQSHEAAGDHAH